jgi:hypothetical protein
MMIDLEIHNDKTGTAELMAIAIGGGAVQGVFCGSAAEIDDWVYDKGFIVNEVIDIVS